MGKGVATGKFIAYYRVSTQRQGQSGLGLEAQQAAVAAFLSDGQRELAGEFKEIETGTGAYALVNRPQLGAALIACKRLNATLVIAKLDRLARNVHFVSGLMESKVKFVAADMPEANELTLHVMAAFAEHEAKRISQRTKEALAAAKARGVQLGKAGPANLRHSIEARQAVANAFAAKLRPLLVSAKAKGLTQQGMAEQLNKIGIPTPEGGRWGVTQVRRVIARLGGI